MQAEDPSATGDQFIQNFHKTGDIIEVEHAVAQYRIALIRMANKNADGGISAQISLADALRIQFEEGTAGEEAFEEALSLTEEALLYIEGIPRYRLRTLQVLGRVLIRLGHAPRYHLLQRAVDTFRQVVGLTTASNSGTLVKALADHAWALTRLYEESRDTSKVVEANSIVDCATSLLPRCDLAKDPDLTRATSKARYHRFIVTGNENDLHEATNVLKDFISSVAPTYRDLHNYWGSLGFCHMRNVITGRLDDLDPAIVAFDVARKLVPANHPLWPMRSGNYASALHDRYGDRSTVEDLDEAVRITRTVVDHLDRMKYRGLQPYFADTYVQNLGHFLEASYTEYGKIELLDEAISVHLSNLSSAPPKRKADALISLARAYVTRFARLGRPSDLEGAISLLEEAHQDAGSGTARLSVTNHLASALLASYDEHKRLSHLARAIAVLRKDMILPDRRSQGIYHSLLGRVLQRRFMESSSHHHLEESIHHQKTALQYFLEGTSNAIIVCFSLATAEFQLFLATRSLKIGYECIDSLQRILSSISPSHPERSKYLVELGKAQLAVSGIAADGSSSHALATFCSAANELHSWTSDRYTGALWWAKAAHERGNLSQALEGYRLAISFLPEMASFGVEHELRMRSLSKQAPDLCQNAAACAIQLGELELAIELMEAGRSVVWNMGQELRADLSRLKEVVPSLARELEETNSSLESRQMQRQDLKNKDRESDHRQLHRLATRRAELIELIRGESGFENFLRPPAYVQLSQAAVGGPVVIINTSIYRSDAVLVRADGPPVLVPLPLLRQDQARQDAASMSALSQVPKDKRGMRFAESVLVNLLRRLWETVGRAVYVELAFQSARGSPPPRVWWCPSGPMSFLPIHACGPLDDMEPDLMDLVISSYTPTLSALVRARNSTSRSPKASPKMLAIVQPNLPGHVPLPSAMKELDVLRTFPGPTRFLIGPTGTVSTMEEELPSHSWIHVSSHGRQDFLQPMESSIALHDGPFTLLHLTKARLPDAEFAFLSACYSARGTEWIADESMHLAAGFLFAGYKSIVATSRAIADRDAPVVARAFYAYLTRNGRTPEMTDAAEALRLAIRVLRETGVPVFRWAPFIHIGV